MEIGEFGLDICGDGVSGTIWMFWGSGMLRGIIKHGISSVVLGIYCSKTTFRFSC